MRTRVIVTTRTTRIGLAVVAGLLTLAWTSVAAGAAGTGSSGVAGQERADASAAATKAGSARISVHFFSGSTTGKVLQDSSLRTGTETVSIGKALASIVLVGGTAYISGNRQGLTSYFGLPSALLSRALGHSISIKQSDSAFGAITTNVTLLSALTNVTPSGNVLEGKRTTVNGMPVKSISGTGPGGAGKVTLFIASTGRPLPVEAVETSTSGTSKSGEVISFTQWGEQVHATKPTKVIPLSLLQAAAPAQG